MICFKCARLIAYLALPTALVLNVLHPLIHGTPLDSGALDAMIQNLNALALAPKEA